MPRHKAFTTEHQITADLQNVHVAKMVLNSRSYSDASTGVKAKVREAMDLLDEAISLLWGLSK